MTDKIFLALMAAFTAHRDCAKKEFRKLDLSDGQPKILYILNFNQGLSQKELASLCGLTAPTLAVQLQRLEGDGLVLKKKLVVSGKSSNLLYLTEAGLKKARSIEAIVDDLEEVAFSNFSPEEKKILFDLLEKLRKNLC